MYKQCISYEDFKAPPTALLGIYFQHQVSQWYILVHLIYMYMYIVATCTS